jgi:hypothetical protein
MLLKCNDFKFVDFNDKLIQFSTTLKAIQKYSISNEASINFCDSHSIIIIQDWLKTRYYTDTDQILSVENSELYFHDQLMISISKSATKKKPLIIYLLKIADFLNINFLVDSILKCIAVKLFNFSPSRIHDFLNNKSIQLEHKHKIFFIICEKKFCNNEQNYTKFEEHEISNFNNYMHKPCKKSLKTCFYELYYKKLLNISVDQKISLSYFKIFDSLNSMFICYEKNENILQYFKLKKAKLNLKLNKKFFFKHIDKYLDDAFLAGGCFSSYNADNIFVKKYLDLKNICIENQDFDIFIIDKSMIKFNFFCEKFENYKGFTKSLAMDYQLTQSMTINTIKVKLDEKIVNFIFINAEHKIYNNYTEIDTFIHFIFKFDFNLTRIFYSFKLKKTFIYVGLFNIFDNFEENSCSQVFLKDFAKKFVDKKLEILKNFSYLEGQFKLMKVSVKIVENYINLGKILGEIDSFQLKFEYLANLFGSFPHEIYKKHNSSYFFGSVKGLIYFINLCVERRNLTRFIKYLIKGCYYPENEQEILNTLDFTFEIFYDFFKMAIESKREFEMEIYFECLLKFLLS